MYIVSCNTFRIVSKEILEDCTITDFKIRVATFSNKESKGGLWEITIIYLRWSLVNREAIFIDWLWIIR